MRLRASMVNVCLKEGRLSITESHQTSDRIDSYLEVPPLDRGLQVGVPGGPFGELIKHGLQFSERISAAVHNFWLQGNTTPQDFDLAKPDSGCLHVDTHRRPKILKTDEQSKLRAQELYIVATGLYSQERERDSERSQRY